MHGGTMTTQGMRRNLPSSRGSRIATLLFLATAILLYSPARAATEAVEDGIRFSLTDPAAQSVALAGEFNNWSTTATPMNKEGDVWSITMALEAGKHEYKFVIDGQWVADPDNPVTSGEYGNSALTVLSDGSIMAMQATSNVSLSPKLLVGGRVFGRYEARSTEERDKQYELRRPNLDMDIDFRVRINDELNAHMLTSINNESENIDFWQTRLNFERGSLTLDNPTVFLKAWDNEAVGTWDDPLHLVGNVGIYQYEYGYNTVGAKLRKRLHGFDAEIIYSDDSEPGGTDHPSPLLGNLVAAENLEERDPGTLSFAEGSLHDYQMSNTDNGRDVLAGRVKRKLGRFLGGIWDLGLSGRWNRGFNPGGLAVIEVDPGDTTQTTGLLYEYPNAFESSRALGGDLRWQLGDAVSITAEYLQGDLWIDAQKSDALVTNVTLETTAVGDSLTGSLSRGGDQPAPPARDIDLDESHRAHLGLSWEDGPLGFDWGLAWEYQDHSLDPLATSAGKQLENEMALWQAVLHRENPRCRLTGLPMEAALFLEYHDFTYDPATPWNAQFWFDARNFWLEHDEHVVTYDRMTLLGGRDALLWKPALHFTLEEAHRTELSYRGTFAAQDFGKRPKYSESIFVLQRFIRPAWRLSWDLRLARYTDAVLAIDDAYHASFVELAYMPAEGVSLALSYGVDPHVIDEATNEFGEIGRDQFLFTNGANAAAAETNYRGLGRLIRRAEQALEDERRIQLEAVLVF